MNFSIRRYLIINLLLFILIATLASSVINYYFNYRSISAHLDNTLKQFAYTLQAVINANLKSTQLANTQKNLDDLLAQENTYYPNVHLLAYQKENELILYSKNTPAIPLPLPPNQISTGFYTVAVQEKPWRVFALKDENSGLTIITAEKNNTHHELISQLDKRSIYLYLFSIPILCFIIWFVVNRSLKNIDKVTSELRNRAVNNLTKIDIKNIPTEIKPLTDELNNLLNRLRQAFEREKAFSSNAAHELRTPLAALKTQAQVAIKAKTSQEYQNALKNLVASVDRSTHVVEQLLTLSRLLPESSLQSAKKINLSRITTEVVAFLAPEAISKNIDIALVGGEDNIQIFGISTGISILMRNLVDNAIRYTPHNGEIYIFIEKIKQHPQIRVVDNGPGIAPELRNQVFERFYRVTGMQSPGSGLGLAIVREIASIHQAKIFLNTPKSGQGLEIKLVFPAITD
jgi:two-component system sensor histidine kinase QseC